MKKLSLILITLVVLALALSVLVSAEGIGFRGFETVSVSESGLSRTTFSPKIASDEGGSLKRAALPSKYDARDHGVVTSVKDQGMYGSCWAFSAISCAESSLISKYPSTFTKSSTDLSEVQHAYFSYSAAPDKLNMTGDKNVLKKYDYLDAGGNIYTSATTFAKGFGAADEKSVISYENATPSTTISNSKAFSGNVATLKNCFWISASDKTTIKEMIMKYGSVSASCYFDYSCYNEDHAALYCSADTYGNHQITLVGWDDDYSKSNFGYSRKTIFGTISLYQPKSNGAWLVKNSYGESEGEEGYFWLSYNDKAFLKDEVGVYDFNLVDKTESNYQYDGSAALGYFFGEKKIYGANVFTSNGVEALREIGLFVDDNSSTYKYQIFLNPKTKDPASGTPVFSSFRNAGIKYCGYNTIRLPNEIQLGKGTRFSVVILVSNKKNATICAEFDGFLDLDRTVKAVTTVRKGESFVSEDGKDWEDATEIKDGNNLRIKAITRNGYAKPKSISAKNVSVEIGKSASIGATVTPGFASKSLIFSSADPAVASVSTDGKVFGKKIGSCRITISSKADEKIKTVITVSVVPAAPSSFKAGKSSTSAVNVSWSAVKDAAGYKVFIDKNGALSLLGKTEKTSFKVKNLSAGGKYKVFVSSFVKGGGKEIDSPKVELKIATKPAAPKLKISKTAATKATLSWNAVSGADKYVVYKYNASKDAFVKCKTVSATTLKVTKLKGGDRFAVRALVVFNGKNYFSAQSNAVTFK